MIFSVPKAAGGYRYYRSAGIFTAPPPRRPVPGQLGMPVTEAAPPLPADAAYVGEGEQARGTVASGEGTSLVQLGILGGLGAALLWVLFRR